MDVVEQLKRTPVGLDSTLGRTVPFGVAYHHAGLQYKLIYFIIIRWIPIFVDFVGTAEPRK